MKRKNRLTHSNDFKRVRRKGKSYSHPLAVMIVGKGLEKDSRAGIVVTKSLGGAVQRNHIKRQLREIITSVLPELTEKVDLLFIPREPASRASFHEIQSAVMVLLGKAGLIVSDNNGSGR